MLQSITDRLKYGCFQLGLNALFSHAVKMPIILCFHRIKAPSSSFLDQRLDALAPEQFSWIITYVQSMGYQFVSLQTMYCHVMQSQFQREAAITFDDGFHDQYENAYPLLKELGIPFTLFLTTSTVEANSLLWLHKLYVLIGHMDRDEAKALLAKHVAHAHGSLGLMGIVRKLILSKNRRRVQDLIEAFAQKVGWTPDQERQWCRQMYLTTAQVKAMQDEGVTIEAHGHEHLPWDVLPQDQVRRDIVQSVSWIEENLAYRPRFLAYPFGFLNPLSVGILKELGFVGACTTEHRPIRIRQDPFSLPRIYRDMYSRPRFAWRLSRSYFVSMKEHMWPFRRRMKPTL